MTLRIGILTISDRASAGSIRDLGGPAVADSLQPHGWTIVRREIVPDDRDRITDMLKAWSDVDRLDVVLTTGGTGLSERDVTPEATLAIGDRQVPGIAEAIRAASLVQTSMAMISRGVAVVRGSTLVINLPGNPRGAAQATGVVAPILEHAIATMHGGKHGA